MQRYFIIGTDTDCGKTYVTCQLLQYFKHALAIKPVESGGTADAEQLATYQPHYTSPLACYRFKPAISPHIAAAQSQQTIAFDTLDAFCNAPELSAYQTLFIETSGGLMCPLNTDQTWLDYIKHAKIPVIFVVGLRLGCLNHALLTAHTLKTHGVPCVGWIANQCDPNMQVISENIQTLEHKLPYQRLATIVFNGTMAHEEWILAH